MAGKMIIWSLALSLVLSGCVNIPGSHISLGTNAPANDAKVELGENVTVRAITPGLISQIQEKPAPAPVANSELNQALHAYNYVVGSGDVLNVIVWGHPELTSPAITASSSGFDASRAMTFGGAANVFGNGTKTASTSSGGSGPGFTVDGDGTIYYPYVGAVKVAGLNVRDVRKLLRDRLSVYIPSPQLDVAVSAFRAQHVYVTGEIKAPGTIPITNVPLTLLDAVNQAGGVMPTSDWSNVILTRTGHEYHYSLRDLYQRGDTRQNTLLEADDVVFVPQREAEKVFVLGEVNKQQTVPMGMAGLTLADALAQAGGINQLTADASGIFVLRRSDIAGTGKLIDVFQLNAKDAVAFVLADGFPLHEHDIIFVTAAPLERWNKVINLLLPSLDFLYLDSAAQNNFKLR